MMYLVGAVITVTSPVALWSFLHGIRARLRGERVARELRMGRLLLDQVAAYLTERFVVTASARSRGYLLPEHQQAFHVIEEADRKLLRDLAKQPLPYWRKVRK